jgi:hypothetical protein
LQTQRPPPPDLTNTDPNQSGASYLTLHHFC